MHFSFGSSLDLGPRFLPADIIGPVRVGLIFVSLCTHTATTYSNSFSGLFMPFHYVTSSICGGGRLVLGHNSLNSTMQTSVDFPFVFGPVRVSDVLTCSNKVCGGFPASIVHRSFRPSVVVNDIMSAGPKGPGRGSLVDRVRGVIVRGASCSLPSSTNVLVAFGCGSMDLVSFRHVSRLRGVKCSHAVDLVSSVGDHVRHEIGISGVHLEQLICGDGCPRLEFGGVCVSKTGARRRICVGGRFRASSSGRFACRSLGQKCFHLLSSGVVSRVVPRTIFGPRSSACSLRLGVGVRGRFSIHIKNGISAADSGRVCLKLTCRGLGCCSGRFALSKRLNGVCGGTRFVTGISFTAAVPASCHFVTSVDAFSCFEGSGLFSGGSGPTFGRGSRQFLGLGITLPFLSDGELRLNFKVTRVRSQCFRGGIVSFSGSGCSGDKCHLFNNSIDFGNDALGSERFPVRNTERTLITRVFAKGRDFHPKIGSRGGGPMGRGRS